MKPETTQPTFLPATGIAIILTVVLVYSFWVLHQTTQQPWLGLRFAADPHSPTGLRVSSVSAAGPAAGRLRRGQRVVSLEGKNGHVALSPAMLRQPDWFPTYREFNQFLANQDLASRILREPTVTLRLDNDASVTLHPASSRPLWALPVVHWLYLLFGLAGFIIGLIVWRHRPRFLPAAMLFVAGAGALLHYYGAVMVERELALPAARIQSHAIASTFGSHAFVWAEIGIFQIYPRALTRPFMLLPVLLVLMLLAINSALQLVELPLHTYFLPYALIVFWYFPLLFLQWRSSRRRALERAFLKLAILAMVLPATLVILFFIIPRLLHYGEPIPQDYAKLVMVPMILSWAIGLMRYRLFDVELWWFKSMIWVIGGFMVLLFDLAFVGLAGMTNVRALGSALVTAGFVYFPIRQWLLTRWLSRREPSLHEQLSELARLFASARDEPEFERRWAHELGNRFHPTTLEKKDMPLRSPEIKNHGLDLCAPSLDGRYSYALHGKDNGDRLFRPRDATTVSALLSMARLARNSSEERFRAAAEERKRIMTDLHDTLGARLLTLAHRAKDQEMASDIRDALEILRETVRLSTKTGPLQLSALLADLRAEAAQRTEAAQVELHWNGMIHDQRKKILPLHALVLSNVLRETVSNALKHGRPDHLYIILRERNNRLDLTIGNDGNTSDPAHWRAGFGLANMQSRLEALGGTLEAKLIGGFGDPEQPLVAIRISLPTGEAYPHTLIPV